MRLYSRAFAIALCLVPIAVHARNVSPAYHRARMKGAKAEIRLVVRDDEGRPVPEASVRAIFDMPDEEYSLYGKTDTNGTLVVRGKTNGNYIKFLVGKNGYYGSQKEIVYARMGAEHEVKDGKWQPYGANEEIVLRRILNPISLISKGKEYDIPLTNKWIGFDIIDMDWVHPYGMGRVNDFDLFFEWDGLFQNKSAFQKLQIHFANNIDGAFVKSNSTYSDNPYVYMVDTNALFQKEFGFFIFREGTRVARQRMGDDEEMLFRIRCETNNVGKLISCRYGRLRSFSFGGGANGKGHLYVFSDLNTKFNDPNLEDVETTKISRNSLRFCEESQDDD